jgi:hypothetical protein
MIAWWCVPSCSSPLSRSLLLDLRCPAPIKAQVVAAKDGRSISPVHGMHAYSSYTAPVSRCLSIFDKAGKMQPLQTMLEFTITPVATPDEVRKEQLHEAVGEANDVVNMNPAPSGVDNVVALRGAVMGWRKVRERRENLSFFLTCADARAGAQDIHERLSLRAVQGGVAALRAARGPGRRRVPVGSAATVGPVTGHSHMQAQVQQQQHHHHHGRAHASPMGMSATQHGSPLRTTPPLPLPLMGRGMTSPPPPAWARAAEAEAADAGAARGTRVVRTRMRIGSICTRRRTHTRRRMRTMCMGSRSRNHMRTHTGTLARTRTRTSCPRRRLRPAGMRARTRLGTACTLTKRQVMSQFIHITFRCPCRP